MQCSSATVTGNYVPPPLGNGDFSLLMDYEGVQSQKTYHGMTPCIYRAGRRYDSPGGPLVPWGYILQNSGPVKHWTQELDVTNARIVADCEYEDGSRIATEAFVHMEQPLLAIRKRFTAPYVFRYLLAAPGCEALPPKRMTFFSQFRVGGVDIHYQLDGLPETRGIISVWCDRPDVTVTANGHEFCFSFEEAGEAAFFIAIHDSLDHADVVAAMQILRRQVEASGYDGIFAAHRAAWAAYWHESYIKLPGIREQSLYETAQYHLRISSTRWSLPVGIYPTHWQGRYFAFDEHFSFMGLLTSNHHAMARRIPEFRHKTLPKAMERAHCYFGQRNSGARWYWELLENGDMEGAPGGFWLDHIFHMANVAMSAWHYYRFTGDREFLEQMGYPLLRGCADFYQTQSIQKVGDDRYIVGKCTDLERLGPGRDNAFMTTCGVIATLEAAAAAAELLNIDGEVAAQERFFAGKLRKTLPQNDERFMLYPGCNESSIAVFAGTFPYQVLPPDDRRQQAAIAEYLRNENAFGNMYPVGNSVCTWYAAWKGIGLARLGNLAAARHCLEQCVAEADKNCFSEIFEISNPACHPWFTTAEGSYIQLVNEMLLQSREEEIHLIDGGWQDYAFKLAAVGGVTVEAEYANGKISHLEVSAAIPYQGRIVLPDGQCHLLDLPDGGTLAIKL